MRARGVEGWGKGVFFFLAVSQESLSLLVSPGRSGGDRARRQPRARPEKSLLEEASESESGVYLEDATVESHTCGAGTAMSGLTTIPLLSGNWWS